MPSLSMASGFSGSWQMKSGTFDRRGQGLACRISADYRWQVLRPFRGNTGRSDRMSRLHLRQSVWQGKAKSLVRGSPRAALNSAAYRKQKAEEEEEKLENGVEDDEDTCPVDCVREFSSKTEFEEILANSKADNSLVVVDFYRTACGSCKYIEKGFIKLCKGAGNGSSAIVFLKHNVMDEYEEQSEVAAGFKIRAVPLFHFYKAGELVEAFPTREKSRILAAIYKHSGVQDPSLD